MWCVEAAMLGFPLLCYFALFSGVMHFALLCCANPSCCVVSWG